MTGSVRPARPGDRAAVLALQLELSRPNPRLLRAALDGVGTVLVSTAGDRPVGYLLAIPGSESVHAAELAVAPDHRREGRATALLEALAAREDARITLAVAPGNDAARRCYEAVGFQVVERDPDYFAGDPALVMAMESAE